MTPHHQLPAKKDAVLEVTRSDNGDATYRLLIDGVPQKLGDSLAKWDDASPWDSGHYNSRFSKLRGKYDAFLIEWPPHRSDIKFHLGTQTGHSEGCIVTKNANIVEIEKALADNGIPKDELKFDVKGDFPIGFSLSIKDDIHEVDGGGSITLAIALTGGGAPGGVSKDIWFHIVADSLDAKEFSVPRQTKIPQYVSRSSYPNSKTGVLVQLPKGSRSVDVEIALHAMLKPPMVKTATFSVDNYKILNQAPGPAPYFYTPSDYRRVLGTTAKTSAISIKANAAADTIGNAVRHAPHPVRRWRTP